MKRAIYAFFTAVALLSMDAAMAQSVPSVDRLTSLQRQQLSRDLVPSSAQDFFRAGQANLEQEIRWLTRQPSPDENLLKVSQGALMQLKEQGKQPTLQHDRIKLH